MSRAAPLAVIAALLLLAEPSILAAVDDGGPAAPAATTAGRAADQDAEHAEHADPGPSKFLYFAYGSNLLARRIQLMNPTARRFGIGLLKDYRLDFSTPPSKRWGGAPATVVPDEGEGVWGAVWALDRAEQDNLDEQEGVHTGWYDVINATVTTPGGRPLACRSYLMRVAPPKRPAGEPLPAERQPSLVYKRVVLAGARESGLPASYVARLEAIPDNGSPGVDPPVSLDDLPA